jgi:hypothetical protein
MAPALRTQEEARTMFRKLSISMLALVAVVIAAACNSTLGPQTTSGGSDGDRGPRDPMQLEKACIQELRSVEITSPEESRRVYGGDYVVITWANHHICGGYDSAVEISYDGGRTFTLLGKKRNGVSMGWRVPELDGVQVVIRVRTVDAFGVVSDDLGLANPIFRRDDSPERDREDHD